MRKKIYDIIESENTTDVYDIFMVIVIIASLVPLAFKQEYPALVVLDKCCVFIFIVDYILRLITADYILGKKSVSSFFKYPFSPMAIIDLISILPSISFINNSLKVLRIIRMARAIRVIRVFKVVRYSKSFRIISDVLKTSKEPLMAVCTLAVGYILISALVIMNVEPQSFDNFFDAIYWATVSLTTVGYGDLYPVTYVGRIVTMISSIFGIAIIALPSGIITAGYMRALKSDNDKNNLDSKNK